MILGLLWSELVYAGQKIIYIGGSTWTLESSESGKKYTYHFYEGGKCQVTWVDWWTYTDNNCLWKQEGPKLEIIYGKKRERSLSGYIKDDYFKGRYNHTGGYTGIFSGSVDYYEKVYTDWVSPEEQKRIAEEKKRLEYEKEMQREAREYEERKRLAEANNNTKSNSNLSGRERAKQVASYKAGGALKGFLGGLIGLAIGFGLYSIMDRKIKNKLNDKFFLGAAFFIGWIITKFI